MDQGQLLRTAVVTAAAIFLGSCAGSSDTTSPPEATSPTTDNQAIASSSLPTTAPITTVNSGDQRIHRFFDPVDRPDLGPFNSYPPLATVDQFAAQADIVFVGSLVDVQLNSARMGIGDPFTWIYDGLVFNVERVLAGEVAAKNSDGQIVVNQPVQLLTPGEANADLRERTIRTETIEPFRAGLSKLGTGEQPDRFVVFALKADFTAGGVGYHLFHPDGVLRLNKDGFVSSSATGPYSFLPEGPVDVDQIAIDLVEGREFPPPSEDELPGPDDPPGKIESGE